MAKYRINYVIERAYSIDIEAESEYEARRMFMFGDIDYQSYPAKDRGSELQDSVEVRLINE